MSFCLLITTGCSNGNISKISREDDNDLTLIIKPNSDEDINSWMRSIEEKNAGDLSEEEYQYFPFYFLNRLSKYSTYQSETSGNTQATVLGVTTTQTISAKAIKSEYSYMKNESHSNIVNLVHEAYFHSQEVIYRNNGDKYTLSELSDYLDTFGVNPFGSTIEGYSVSQGAINSISREKYDNYYVFNLDFNVDTATNNVKIQMKKFGSLDNYPTFKLINVAVMVQDDFTPVKIELNSKYKVKKIVDSNCTQKYTVIYSHFNEDIKIPNLDKIKPQFTD